MFLGHFILVENDPSLTTLFLMLTCLSYDAHLVSIRMSIICCLECLWGREQSLSYMTSLPYSLLTLVTPLPS